MEESGDYCLEVVEGISYYQGKWIYLIYKKGNTLHPICKSNEWFDSAGRARLAGLGHISLIEKGEE